MPESMWRRILARKSIPPEADRYKKLMGIYRKAIAMHK
jgi:hypothetical protein